MKAILHKGNLTEEAKEYITQELFNIIVDRGDYGRTVQERLDTLEVLLNHRCELSTGW